MKISDTQRRILSAIIHYPEAPIAELARRAGVKEHTLRYVQKQLIQKKILAPYYYINLCSFGLHRYNMYFSVSAEHAPRVIALLKNDPRVTWFAENTGVPRFEVTLSVGNPAELGATFNRVAEETGAMLQDRRWAVYGNYYHFGKRFLGHSGKKPIYSFTDAASKKRSKVSKIDLSIIDLMNVSTDPASSSVSYIARQLKLPPATVSYHHKRLRELNVLSPCLYTVNSEDTGILSFQLLISLRSTRTDFTRDVLKFCGDHPEVTTLIESFGSWDYKMVLFAESAREVLRVKDELEVTFQGMLAEVSLISRGRDLSVATNVRKHPELVEQGM